MTVVVDLGCNAYPDHPNDESVETLLARFRPALFYGFDPHPDMDETCASRNGGKVTISRRAAWTYNGTVGFRANGITSRLGGRTQVPCFDLAAWIDGPVILKVDIEGGEYELLEHLIATGAHRNVERLLIEWHGAGETVLRRAAILAEFDCPVELWH